MFGVAAAVAMLSLFGTQAWAQQTAPPAPVKDQSPAEPTMNLSLAYAFMRDNSWEENLYYGWVATLSYRLGRNVSLVGEFGGGHGEFRDTGFTIQRYALLGGLKLSGGEGNVRPFFQVLAGGARQGGDVGLAHGIVVQPGGGVDLTLNERWTFRVQGDFRWLREDEENWTQYRLSGGVVIYLGRRR
jgi:hypothetical protein